MLCYLSGLTRHLGPVSSDISICINMFMETLEHSRFASPYPALRHAWHLMPLLYHTAPGPRLPPPAAPARHLIAAGPRLPPDLPTKPPPPDETSTTSTTITRPTPMPQAVPMHLPSATSDYLLSPARILSCGSP